MAKLGRVKDLYAETVNYQAVSKDWTDDGPQDWETVIDGMKEEDLEDYGPKMSYYYLLPKDFYEDHSTAQSGSLAGAVGEVNKCNLCLVYLKEEDRYALVLTGGGMDLSWSICEGFMRLGFLPPLKFCELPNYHQKLTTRLLWVVAGCRRSARVSALWSKSTLDHLKRYSRAKKQEVEVKA